MPDGGQYLVCVHCKLFQKQRGQHPMEVPLLKYATINRRKMPNSLRVRLISIKVYFSAAQRATAVVYPQCQSIYRVPSHLWMRGLLFEPQGGRAGPSITMPRQVTDLINHLTVNLIQFYPQWFTIRPLSIQVVAVAAGPSSDGTNTPQG